MQYVGPKLSIRVCEFYDANCPLHEMRLPDFKIDIRTFDNFIAWGAIPDFLNTSIKSNKLLLGQN